jgi:hypothetical protein
MSIFQLQSPWHEKRLSPGAEAGSRIDQETTPGRCRNLDYCSIGMQRVLVQVPISQPFVCPECGGKLRPPGPIVRSTKPSYLPILRLAVLIAAMGICLSVGYTLGRVRPLIASAVKSASQEVAARIGQAGTDARLNPPAPPAPAAAKVVAPPKAPILVSNRPYPAHAPAIDAAVPPVHLQHEARFGQVTIDCVLASFAAKPNCHVADIRGGDAFSAASLAFLQGLAVQYAPGERGGAKVLLDHRWRVVLEDFSGLQK